MNTQIFQVRLGDHLSHRIGQRADTKLQRGAVHHVLHHIFRDLHLRLRSCGRFHAGQRAVIAFHDHVHIVNMDTLIQTAVNPGQVLVDLQNHHIRLVQHTAGRGIADREVKVTVLIHRRHAHHGHINSQEMRIVGTQITENHGNKVAQSLVAELTLIAGHMPAIIQEVLTGGVTFHHLDGLLDQIASDFYIEQFIPAFGNSGIHQRRKGTAHGNIQPVTAFYDLGRFVRRAELASVFR